MVIDPDTVPSGSNGRSMSPQYAAASRQACRSTVPTRLGLCDGSTWPAADAGPQAMPAASRAGTAPAGPPPLTSRTSLAERRLTGVRCMWFFLLFVQFRQQLGQRIERLPRKTLERI